MTQQNHITMLRKGLIKIGCFAGSNIIDDNNKVDITMCDISLGKDVHNWYRVTIYYFIIVRWHIIFLVKTRN